MNLDDLAKLAAAYDLVIAVPRSGPPFELTSTQREALTTWADSEFILLDQRPRQGKEWIAEVFRRTSMDISDPTPVEEDGEVVAYEYTVVFGIPELYLWSLASHADTPRKQAANALLSQPTGEWT